MASQIHLKLVLIAICLIIVLPPMLAKLRDEKPDLEVNSESKASFFADHEREKLLRKVLRQSGFNTDEEIDEAIIALGPPPKKKMKHLSSDELEDEKQQNFDKELHKTHLQQHRSRQSSNGKSGEE